ncbi:MAG TPA: YciI family protein, partial [Longimicrobiales bacterium]
EGLTPPRDAKVVRSGKNGVPAITDGPFPETKEFLAGYWIVDVETPQRAYEIAAKVSAAPGPGGQPLVIPVEVRQVMSAPATEL